MQTTYIINMPKDEGIKYECFRYPAGEYQVRIKPTELKAILQATEVRVIARKQEGFVEKLALMADAIHIIVGNTAAMNLVLPYLPYSRADRRFTEGDCFGLRVFGQLIDAMGFWSVLTIDAHSKVAKKAIANLVDIDPSSLIHQAIADQTVLGDMPTILFPDQGARDRYTPLGVPKDKIEYCTKERDPLTGKILGITVPEKEFGNVLIVDDICDGGATFIDIAQKVKCTFLGLYVTHGIFSKGLAPLYQHIDKIYTSDTFAEKGSVEERFSLQEPYTIFSTEELITQAAEKLLTPVS